MKEVYLLNLGDTMEKVKAELGDGDYVLGDKRICGKDNIVLKNGCDDVVVIKNYAPLIVTTIKAGETPMDIMARGFEIVAKTGDEDGDRVILTKPRSVRYVVSPLETLDEIANKFGVDRSVIMSSNKLTSSKLFVGQILWI